MQHAVSLAQNLTLLSNVSMFHLRSEQLFPTDGCHNTPPNPDLQINLTLYLLCHAHTALVLLPLHKWLSVVSRLFCRAARTNVFASLSSRDVFDIIFNLLTPFPICLHPRSAAGTQALPRHSCHVGLFFALVVKKNVQERVDNWLGVVTFCEPKDTHRVA